MTRLSAFILAVIFSVWSATSFAVPMTDSVGNVGILGNTYALTILYDDAGDDLEQTYNALTPALTFLTQADATAAVNAMFAAFPLFDWNPAETNTGGTRVVYAVNDTNYQYMVIEDDFFGNVPAGPFNGDRDGPNRYSFAEFELIDTNPAPAPGVLALFCLGLAGLGYSRKKRT